MRPTAEIYYRNLFIQAVCLAYEFTSVHHISKELQLSHSYVKRIIKGEIK